MRKTRLISLFLLYSPLTSAQDPHFTASVDRTQVAMGERVEISFTLTGASTGKNFRPPPFSDFIVLSGPNQSTSMQFANGAMSASVSFGYLLQPRSEGKFTIAPARIDYGGKQLQTQPITIEVVRGAPSAKQKPGRQDDSDFGMQLGDNLALKVTVDKARAYQGEQVTATYKLFTRVNVANYSVTKTPSLTGFWSEDLDLPKQIQLSTELVNGKQYRVGVLRKVALFPQRSGSLEIDPMEVECVVQVQTRRRPRDLFDQFFSDPFLGNVANVNHTVRSEPLTITVMPLPTENVPASFTGAVGRYGLETRLDKQQTRTNEPVTLRVKISGRGNIKLLESPAVTITADLERYDPKISDNINKQGDQVGGSRTFEYLLIPRHPGEQRIPPVVFSYFDPERRSYQTLKSLEFPIHVERGTDFTPSGVSGLSKEEVRLLAEDIRFIKSGDVSFQRRDDRFVGSPLFMALSVGPFVTFLGFFLYMRHRERLAGDLITHRNRRARKIAGRRLASARKFLQDNKKQEFYAEVSRALWGYLADKLGIPPAELSTDSMCASLEARGVSAGSIQELTSVISLCEFARFAPPGDSLQMDAMYNNAADVIRTVEEQLR